AVRSAEDAGDGAEAPHPRLTFPLHARPGGWKPLLVTGWFDVEGVSLAAQGDPVLVCLSPNPIDVPVEVRIEAARTDPEQIVAVQRSLFGADIERRRGVGPVVLSEAEVAHDCFLSIGPWRHRTDG